VDRYVEEVHRLAGSDPARPVGIIHVALALTGRRDCFEAPGAQSRIQWDMRNGGWFLVLARVEDPRELAASVACAVAIWFVRTRPLWAPDAMPPAVPDLDAFARSVLLPTPLMLRAVGIVGLSAPALRGLLTAPSTWIDQRVRDVRRKSGAYSRVG